MGRQIWVDSSSGESAPSRERSGVRIPLGSKFQKAMLRETERIGWYVFYQHDAGYTAPLKQLVPREPHKMLGLMPASV